MKVMAFEAHPDDVDICCSGTLAKYRGEGHEVAIVCVTNGEVGSPTLSKEEIAVIRKEEAANSAAVIGAEFVWMGYPDEFLFNTAEVRLHFIEVIRGFNPDIIICPDKDHDYHPDHTTTGQIIWDTHVMTTVPNIKTESRPCSQIAEIYYMDTLAGVDFRPEFYVDVSAYWEQKKAMLECHTSQMTWLMDQYGASLVENVSIQSRFRGYQSGCGYAEAFRKPKFYPQKSGEKDLLPRPAWIC